jgi:hypothetical protein
MIGVVGFLSAHLDKIGFAYQLIESGSFYKQNETAQLHAQVEKVRSIFDWASWGLAAAACANLLAALEWKWAVCTDILALSYDFRIPLLVFGAGAAGWIGVAYLVVCLVNGVSSPSSDLQRFVPEGASAEAIRSTKIQWTHTGEQENAETHLSTRIITNVALACMCASPYWLLATAALQGLSLLTVAQWKVLEYRREFNSFGVIVPVEGRAVIVPGLDQRIQRMAISFFRPLFPANDEKNEECIVACGNGEKMSQLCETHAAHDECIVGSIYQAMEQFSDPSLHTWIKRFHPVQRTEHITDGILQYVAYDLRVAEEALPKCPGCRGAHLGGELQIEIADAARPVQFSRANVELRPQATLRS